MQIVVKLAYLQGICYMIPPFAFAAEGCILQHKPFAFTSASTWIKKRPHPSVWKDVHPELGTYSNS